MAGFATWAELREAKREGHVFSLGITKASPVSLAGVNGSYWAAAGSPAAGAAPSGATTYLSTDGGVVFPDMDPIRKYLLRWEYVTTFGTAMIQVVDRLVAFGAVAATGVGAKAAATPPLPRYTTGERVRVVLEVRSQTVTASRTVSLTYTNELGVGGRTSTAVVLPTSSGAGLTNQTFFVGLQDGDLGVRSVEALNVTAESGGGSSSVDVVLYHPLAQIVGEPQLLVTSGSHSHWAHSRDFVAEIAACPRIYDGATLSFLCWDGEANGTRDNSFYGNLDVVYR